jgi:hypothetical protein
MSRSRHPGGARLLCLYLQAAFLRAGAPIPPAETVFSSILSGSQHPFLMAFTELVKNYG